MRRGAHAHDPISRIKSAKQIYTWINRAKIIVLNLLTANWTVHIIDLCKHVLISTALSRELLANGANWCNKWNKKMYTYVFESHSKQQYTLCRSNAVYMHCLCYHRLQITFCLYICVCICWFNVDALTQGNACTLTEKPMNYRGPSRDRAPYPQTEATPRAASYPRLFHATGIVSKHNPNDMAEAVLDNWQPIWDAHVLISTPVCVNFELRLGAGEHRIEQNTHPVSVICHES